MPFDGEFAQQTLTSKMPCLIPAHAQPGAPAAAPNSILPMATRIKAILDRETVLDAKHPKGLTEAEDAEEQALYDERIELSEKIVASTPATPIEALIVAMHAIDRICYGVNFDRCQDVVERGERSLRRCHVVLGGALAIDLAPLGADHFLPAYMCRHPAPRAFA